MYLKRLEIFGFKSFADKTVLNFGPGITAIIGPNGCGKSNVFDAIRWVLGEQSVKELRGSSMEDVIFNGTDKKPALGFAEVSLTFSNESRVLPIEYNEVRVTRRLYRSGESEYLINKSTVRLKDITEMFMGTGIGAEAYSMIQQGKVDLVVSARPEDRRVLLDEASGITKYKSKKREALNRLKGTENNLLRITDIVSEVKRQIATCERQAKKARRYKAEFEKLKVLEIKYARYEIDHYDENRQAAAGRLDDLREKEQRLHDELEEFNRLIEHQSALLEELEEKIGEAQAEQIKVDSQIDINLRQIGFNEERIANADGEQQRIAEVQEQLRERCRQQQEKISEVQQFLDGLDENVQKNMADLNDKKQNLQRIEDEIRQAKEHIRQQEENILRITSDQVQSKNRLTENMKQLQGALARQRRLEHERNKVGSEKQDVDERFSRVNQQCGEANQAMSGLRRSLDQKNAEIGSAKRELEQQEALIEDLDRKKLFLKSQKEFIEKLGAQYDEIPDPVVQGRLWVDTPPQEHHTGIVGKVCEVCPPAQAENGRMMYEVRCETKFIELDPMQISIRIDELTARLGGLEQEREILSSRIKDMRAEARDFEERIQEQGRILSGLQAQKDGLQEEVAKLKEELELVLAELDETATSLEAYRQTEEVLSGQLKALEDDLDESQRRIKDHQAGIQARTMEREQTTVAAAQIEAEINSVEDRRSSHSENLRIFKETMENAMTEIARLESEAQRLNSQKSGSEEEIAQIRDTIERQKQERQTLDGELAQKQSQKAEETQRIQSLRTNVTAYGDEIEKLRDQIHQQEMGQQQIGFQAKEIKDRLWQTYKIDLDRPQEWPSLDESVLEGEVAQGGALDPEEMRLVIERLRKRCDSFGTVNLVAIEEFEELKERFEFLTRQQSDLIEAKESLHKTIAKINRETRQMFMNTFTKVSEEFRIYFRMLFGGGEAQLVLLEPENVLESGIDIIARPPGKKRQNISLLSGGEKTLTAIALVFGVFKVNPSPFCVLDEIDAALDESNVGRYSYLLKDFAKIAQFIVITHNKKTIANANVLYGITMQQTGVSKLVSVKFGEKEGELVEEDGRAIPAASG
ncbi:MAG: chromosome segregation SMC family protein [Candidatus Omnitrophota bacterium]